MNKRRHSRILAYARVSTVAQTEGTSLEDQKRALSAYAATLGQKVARFFIEAESGAYEKRERRQEMAALLAEVKHGDLVLCFRIDRWSRDIEHTYRSVREIHACEASIYFVDEHCDPSTPEGDSMMGLRAYFAREEAKRIKARLNGTRNLLLDRGLYAAGLVPWGYRRQDDKRGEEHNLLVVNDDEAEQIRRAFRLCIQGQPISAIARTLDEPRDRIAGALHRRLYLGELQNSAREWIRGRHPVIVDARTFEAAQTALKARMNGSLPPVDGAETSSWWLRDLVRCDKCGAKMGAAYSGPKGPSRRYYFRCVKMCRSRGSYKNSGSYVSVKNTHGDMDPLVWDRLIELKAELSRPAAPAKSPQPDLSKRKALLERRRERFLEQNADGFTTRDQLRAQLAKVDAERLRIAALETAPPAQSPEDRRAELERIERVISIWNRLEAKPRRAVVNRLAVRVLIGSGLSPRVEWRPTDEIDLAEVAELLLTAPARRGGR